MRSQYLSTFCKWMSWCQSHCPSGFHPPPLVQRFWSLSGGALSQWRVYSKTTQKWPSNNCAQLLIGSLELHVPSSSACSSAPASRAEFSVSGCCLHACLCTLCCVVSSWRRESTWYYHCCHLALYAMNQGGHIQIHICYCTCTAQMTIWCENF